MKKNNHVTRKAKSSQHKKVNNTDILDSVYNNPSLALFNIVANLPGHVYWKDLNGIYLGCNDRQAHSLGFSTSQELIGKTDFELPWGNGVAEKFRQADLKVIHSGKTLIVEEPSQMEGKEVIVLSQKAPLKDQSGNIVGILGISFDITERKKMEENLRIAKEAAEVASRAKTEFIANMSHDLRTPLTGIIGMSQILEKEVHNAVEKQHAHWVNESGEQLLGLLNGVLDIVSANSASENEVKHETFDLYQVIQDVLVLERSAVKARQLDIKTHIDGAVPHYVIGDRMKLHRILLNLIGNAIKFTKVGHVEINARLKSLNNDVAHIEFLVIDTGIGIPKELQNKVFDRFFKVSPSYKGIYTGNGVGLHIVKKYIELLGGKVSLTSKLGVGTTFSVILPMKVGQQPEGLSNKKTVISVTEKSVVNLKTAHAELMQVLLVEDNFLALQALKGMITDMQVQVFEAQDAETALSMVQSQPFDLIITDIGLPGKSGYELVKEIRAWEKKHHKEPMLIIGLTGHAVGEIGQLCSEVGISQIYQKPMQLEVLKKVIEEYVKFSRIN